MVLCQQHLLGEHVEMHMFVGTLRKSVSIRGYIDRGQVNPMLITRRHEELAAEMLRRGIKHLSPLPRCRTTQKIESPVDVAANLIELARRCPRCRERQEKYK